MMHARILLADDHEAARKMIRNVLSERTDWKIIAEACDGTEAVKMAHEDCPDVAILDFQMPGLNGIEAAKKILEHCPAAVVVTESLHDVGALMSSLRKAGVRGFVPKTEIATDLIPAIETVLQGGEWFKAVDDPPAEAPRRVFLIERVVDSHMEPGTQSEVQRPHALRSQ
jgi:DNA-binding NarL/FixJ family response regulator